jgi:hypothetical protein
MLGGPYRDGPEPRNQDRGNNNREAVSLADPCAARAVPLHPGAYARGSSKRQVQGASLVETS